MSWNCKHCDASTDDDIGLCWQCGTGIDGSSPPDGWRSERAPAWSPAERQLGCLRCASRMAHLGRKTFQEGSYAAELLLGDFFVNRENFDVYACASCGKVEFYVSGAAP